MYRDIDRVQDAILPFLFRDVMFEHIRQDPKVKDTYNLSIGILEGVLRDCFSGLTPQRHAQLYRRLLRGIHPLQTYMVENQFSTRKVFLVLSEWIKALLEAEALIINPDSEYFHYLEDLGEIIITKGYGEIEGFDKIDASAIKHVPNLHTIAQQQGYF